MWSSFGLLILVLAVSGYFAYRQIVRIDADLIQIVEIEEPLEQAVLEMEINALETARAVFNYVQDLEPEDLEMMRDSEADFEIFAAQFERLAETAEERRLGQEVATLYADFKALGDEIVALADERQSTLEAFRRNVLEIDEILDERLKPSAEGITLDQNKKWKAVVALDELIDESFPAIEVYVVLGDPAQRQKFLGAERDFGRLESLYRQTSLSGEEIRLLNRVHKDFAEAVTAGNRIMAITDELRAKHDRFEDDLTAMDTLLDDRIQPLIHAETIKAAQDAAASTAAAAFWLVVLGVIAVWIAGASGWWISGGIVKPLQELVRGTEIVGGGNLDHRIDARTKDEFGHLAAAFNRMAENLQGSANSLRAAHHDLELRVEERTAELHKSEQRFKDIIEASSDWFWETGRDGAFTFISDRFFEVMKVKPETVIGKMREQFVGDAELEADPEKWRRHFADLEAHRPFRDLEYAIAGADGDTRYIKVSGVPIMDEAGEFHGYRGSDADVTARARAENALKTLNEALEQTIEERTAELRAAQEDLLRKERLAALGQLTATVSHELRNPLATIRTSIFGVRERIRGQDLGLDRALDRVDRSITRCDDIIGDLLDYTRIRELAREATAFDGWLDGVLDEHRIADGVALRRDLGAGVELDIDTNRLRRAVINLVDNACQAMTDGAGDDGRERVVAVETRAADGRLEIAVADTGPGIPADVLPKVFEPLFSTRSFGVGLGLPTVKQIIEQHGGGIEISSDEGRGTRVVLWLPLGKSEKEQA